MARLVVWLSQRHAPGAVASVVVNQRAGTSCGKIGGWLSPSHATLATFQMDLSLEAQQREGLERMIVPGVSELPGFVGGTGILTARLESIVLLTYDSLSAAESMAEDIRGNANIQRHVGLDLVGVRILEVAASA